MKLRVKPIHLLVLPVIWLPLSILACRVFVGTPAPTQTPTPVVSVEALQFTDAQTGERFRALDACIQEFTAQGWRATGYRILGNAYEGRWCRGEGARSDCQITTSTENNRDQHVLYLDTYSYWRSDPEMFGLGLNGLWVPSEDGWGASFSISEGGQGIYGEGVRVSFQLHESGKREPLAQVSVIGPLSYGLLETGVRAPDLSGLSAREKLAVALVSPESMRDQALEAYQSLDVEVEAALRSGQVTACDRDPYQGGGIQPACTPRPLTATELATELERAAAYFARQQSLLQENYQEMYAALLKTFPFERCWP